MWMPSVRAKSNDHVVLTKCLTQQNVKHEEALLSDFVLSKSVDHVRLKWHLTNTITPCVFHLTY